MYGGCCGTGFRPKTQSAQAILLIDQYLSRLSAAKAVIPLPSHSGRSAAEIPSAATTLFRGFHRGKYPVFRPLIPRLVMPNPRRSRLPALYPIEGARSSRQHADDEQSKGTTDQVVHQVSFQKVRSQP